MKYHFVLRIQSCMIDEILAHMEEYPSMFENLNVIEEKVAFERVLEFDTESDDHVKRLVKVIKEMDEKAFVRWDGPVTEFVLGS